MDAEYKLQKNIKIAMLYLEDDDAVNAETFIKKAATLITGTKVSPLAFVSRSLAFPFPVLSTRALQVLFCEHSFDTACSESDTR